MPTYQYACTACDHAFEQFQSFTEDSLTECPECEGRLRKIFNAVGVVFKGSGFYRTDSRGTSSSGSESSSSAGSTTGSDSSSTSGTSSTSSTTGSDSGPSSSSKPAATSGSAA